MSDVQRQIASELDSADIQPSSVAHVWEAKRLQSLNKWSMAKPSAQEMAEAGFYCPNAEFPDSVKCFSCFIELDGWEPSDRPWEEHKKRGMSLNPPCRFVEIGKRESQLLVSDYLDILKSVTLRLAFENCERNLKDALSAHRKKKTSLRKDLQKLGVS